MAEVITIQKSEYGGYWAHVQSQTMDTLGRSEIIANDVIFTREEDEAQARQILRKRAEAGEVRRVRLPEGYYRTWTDETTGEVVETETQDIFVGGGADPSAKELAQAALSITPADNLHVRPGSYQGQQGNQDQQGQQETQDQKESSMAEPEDSAPIQIAAPALTNAPLNPNGVTT